MYKRDIEFDNLFHNKEFLRKTNNGNIWTAEKVVRSPFKDIDIPNITVPEYVWRNLEKWSAKTAVVCGLTDRKHSYLQVYKQSQSFAASLIKKFQLENDDTVAVMLPNMPEYPAIVLGINAAGGVFTTINPVYTSYEVQRQVMMSDAKLIVVTPDNVLKVKEALQLSKKQIPIIVVDIGQDRSSDTVSYNELVENEEDLSILKKVQRQGDDLACLLYSSGTTGLPKGVQLTHKNLVSNCEQQNGEVRHYNYTTDSHQDTVLGIIPWFHIYGLNVILFHKLSTGLKLVAIPKFKPMSFLRALDKYKCSIFYLTPPNVHFLSTYPGVTAKHMDSLRCVIVGAAPLPMHDVQSFLNKVNRDIYVRQAYGLTETSSLATLCPIGYKSYTSVGFALPNVMLRIVDSEMKNLGPNEEGELLIKGPNITRGYKSNDEANKKAFVDGWLKSGDLACIDEDGVVKITDRLKDLIKVKGFQVPPAELESVIKEYPGVFDAAVVGVPDEIAGEKPKAFVVLKEECKTSATDIMEYISTKLAPYKQLKEIEFVDTIPKSGTGKILKRLLARR